MVVCSRMCLKPNLSKSFKHTKDKHTKMLIVGFNISSLNLFMCISCLSMFLETCQHLSQERLWIECTKKILYCNHNRGNKDSSKCQARWYFIVHNLTSSRPCWYRPSTNQVIPLCQDKTCKWHMTYNSWNIIHVAHLMNKYIKNYKGVRMLKIPKNDTCLSF